jgi:hypothetical protein
MKRWLVTTLWVLVLAVSAVAAFGVFVAPFVGFLVALRLGNYRWSAGARNALTVFGACLVLLTIAMPLSLTFREQIREAARGAYCGSKLQQIARAILSYERANGSFPPAYRAGPDRKPWHSWRVLILPYLDTEIFKEYDFREPWDGPKNRQLANAILPDYCCPSAPYSRGEPLMTNYVALTGPGTAWPGPKPTKLADIHDDPAKTILLVEIADSDIPWTEPRDLSLEEVLARDTAGQPRAENQLAESHFFSFHESDVKGAWVAMADGSVHFLPAGFSKEQLKALATINGGEDVDYPDPAPRNAWQRLSWLNRVGLTLFVVSLVALTWRAFRRPRERIPQCRVTGNEPT